MQSASTQQTVKSRWLQNTQDSDIFCVGVSVGVHMHSSLSTFVCVSIQARLVKITLRLIDDDLLSHSLTYCLFLSVALIAQPLLDNLHKTPDRIRISYCVCMCASLYIYFYLKVH